MALIVKRKTAELPFDSLVAAIKSRGDAGATDVEIAKDLNIPVRVVNNALGRAMRMTPIPFKTSYRKQVTGIEAQVSVFHVKEIPAIPPEKPKS